VKQSITNRSTIF